MFRVPGPRGEGAPPADDRGIYFTTPHFDGYPAVLVRIPDLERLDREELGDLLAEAWLTRAKKSVAKAWLAQQASTASGAAHRGRGPRRAALLFRSSRRRRLSRRRGPPIVSKPIPFPAKRKLEMQAYAKRHYGIDSWRLRAPKVIVEHFTVSRRSPRRDAFAADVPDAELHELPGTCAHFVVDTDGTIYQLVPLEVMCRHTVGLNWTAIGIEHVGH